MLSKKSELTQPDVHRSCGTERCVSTETATKRAIAETCPKWNRCSAAYCPALGGSHLKGEQVCLYLRECVKPGGVARVRGILSEELADVVLETGMTTLSSTGALATALLRASRQTSRIDLIHRNAWGRGSKRIAAQRSGGAA